MALEDCHLQHTGYFLSLQVKMENCIAGLHTNISHTEVIKAFCDAYGNLPLDSLEDYNRALDKFQAFVAGISWAIEQ
jgi:hypothetical protein